MNLLEIQLPEGSKIKKLPKEGDALPSIVIELPPSGVANQRALWVRSFQDEKLTKPKSGKGLLLNPAGKLTVG